LGAHHPRCGRGLGEELPEETSDGDQFYSSDDSPCADDPYDECVEESIKWGCIELCYRDGHKCFRYVAPFIPDDEDRTFGFGYVNRRWQPVSLKKVRW